MSQIPQRIFRYELELAERQVLNLPAGHVILSVAQSRTRYAIDMWAVVIPDDERTGQTEVAIQICGTGHPIPDVRMKFVGTVVMSDGYVWHVFRELA
jgi:hypothetical protein